MTFKDYLKEVLDQNNELDIMGLINKIKETPELEQYVNPEAQYDEVHVEIPIDILQRNLGIGLEELQQIENNTDYYEGSIVYNKNGTVSLLGGA